MFKFTKLRKKILLSILSKPTNKSLSKYLQISKQTISDNVRILIQNGFIEETIAFNVRLYTLTAKGIRTCPSFLGGDEAIPLKNQIRSHYLVLKSAIIREAREWAKQAQESWIISHPKNWIEYRKNIFDIMVVKTPNFFFYFFPERIDDDGFSNVDSFIGKANQLKKFLEEEYQGLVLGSPEKVYSIQSQHHAILYDDLAMEYAKTSQKEGYKINYQSDRIHIDQSKGIPELETVNKAYALEDLNKLTQSKEDIIRSPLSFAELVSIVGKIAQAQERGQHQLTETATALNATAKLVEISVKLQSQPTAPSPQEEPESKPKRPDYVG